jgi:DNA-binding transcriptional MerR regulator
LERAVHATGKQTSTEYDLATRSDVKPDTLTFYWHRRKLNLIPVTQRREFNNIRYSKKSSLKKKLT